MQPILDPDERGNLPSASGFHRIVYCAGSPNAEREAMTKLPPEAESSVASQGTIIHEAVTTDDFSELGLTEEKVATRLKTMEENAVKDFILLHSESPTKAVAIREERFWVIHKRTLAPLTSAKLDFACVAKSAKTCLLVDFKTGFKRVTAAAGNWQLKVGLVALDQEYGPFESARVAIAQHRMGEVFDHCDYSRADIDQAYAEIVFYLQRASDPHAPRTAGWWCQYCKALTLCPEHIAWATLPTVLTRSLGELGYRGPLELPKKKDIEARIETLSLEALAFLISRKTALTNLLEAVSNRLRSLDIDTLHGIGLDLKPTGKLKSVNSIAQLWSILSSAGLISEAEFHSICKVGIGDMEKLLVNRLKLKNQCTVDEAKAMLYQIIGAVITETAKASSIVEFKPDAVDIAAEIQK